MASEEKTNKQLPSTDAILFDIWCGMNGWDEIILNKLKELNITTLSALKNAHSALLKAMDSVDWTQCSKPKCICDAQLISTQAQQCYSDGGDGSIQCDGCGQTKEKSEIVYHCNNNKSSKHEEGYDLCPQCTVINTKDSFIRQVNQLKSQQKVVVKYPQSQSRGYYKSKIVTRGITRSMGGGGGGGYGMKKKRKCKSASKKRSRGMAQKSSAAPKKIGFSVGGAKDVNSFRDNILKKKRIPQLNSITFEGIFYDYYFETEEIEMDDTKMDIDDNDDNKEEKEDLPLFYPSYMYSKSYIPNALLMSQSTHISNKANDMIAAEVDDGDYIFDFHLDEVATGDNSEYFLNVGLNSNINEEDFQRKNLNLICVLDVSGSMGSGFSFGAGSGNSKMKIANQCVLSILTHLTHKDRFGLCLFDNSGWQQIQFQAMKRHKLNVLQSIMDCYANGGTNFEGGWNCGIKMFEDALKEESVSDSLDDYENRIIFLTDACPNIGLTNPHSLMGMVEKAANAKKLNQRIYTTFVGVGLDFNANLISEITKVRGANYFAVHSEFEFYQKLSLEFDYFVSPMVFNLKLVLQSEGGEVCIDCVYGSNDININNGEVMSVNTLFPSPPDEDGDVKGGIVLIKLKNNDKSGHNLFVECSFEDKQGKEFKNKQTVNLTAKSGKSDAEFYPNAGTRKGILLSRYVVLMKEWIRKFGQGADIKKTSDEWKEILKSFRDYFKNEMEICKDKTLKQELKILTQIINPSK